MMNREDPKYHVPLRALAPIRQIVVGTSLREGSDDAVRSGIALAEALDAECHVIHVVNWEAPAPALVGGVAEPAISRSVIDRSRQELDQQLLRVEAAEHGQVTRGVEVGTPYRRLIEVGQDIGADLLVVGATERWGKLIGSTTDKLIRKTTCPILIVRRALQLPLERVLVPVDLSELSADALRCGLSFLHQVQPDDSAKTRALFVLGELQRSFSHDMDAERIDRFTRVELDRFVDEHAQQLAEAVQRKIRIGEPLAEILLEAQREEVDLVLIGTHGRGGIERALIGSVTSGLVRDASCSVLVIPPNVAFGAELVDAVAEQIEPHWELPDDAQPAAPSRT